jgi:hypothetical protein
MDPIDRPPPGGSPGDSPFLEESSKRPRVPPHLQKTAHKLDKIVDISLKNYKRLESKLLGVWNALNESDRSALGLRIARVALSLQNIKKTAAVTKILDTLIPEPDLSSSTQRKKVASALAKMREETLDRITARLADETPLSEDEEFKLQGDFIAAYRSRKFPRDRIALAHLAEIATKLQLPMLAAEIRIKRFQTLLDTVLKGDPESARAEFFNLWHTLNFLDRTDFSHHLLEIISLLPQNRELAHITKLLTTHDSLDSLEDDSVAKEFIRKHCPSIAPADFENLETVRSAFIDFFRAGRFVSTLDFAFTLKEMADKLELPEIAQEIRSHINLYLNEASAAKHASIEPLEDLTGLVAETKRIQELTAEALYYKNNIPLLPEENKVTFYLFASEATYFSAQLSKTKNTPLKMRMLETLRTIKEKTPDDDYFFIIRSKLNSSIRELETHLTHQKKD